MCVGIIAKWIPDFGKTHDSAKNVESRWFIMDIISRNDFFNNINGVYKTIDFYKKNYNGNKDHIKLALINPVELSTKETTAIDYTYQIKLIQRLWRKKYNSRQK